jgi:tellurite resistance protein TehA-like permease
MIIFGIGFTAVFLIFALLYFHAYRKRSALELNELEIYDTRTQIQDNALNVGVGLLSIALAFGGRQFVVFSMMVYWLIGPVQTVHGIIMGRRRRRLEKRLDEASPEAA